MPSASNTMQHNWKGSKEPLLAQLVRLAEQFIGSGSNHRHINLTASQTPCIM